MTASPRLAETPPAPRRQRAITTPALDLALVGGLSIAVTAAVLVVRPGFDHDDLLQRLIFWTAIINWPHFMASLSLLYGSRERVREHRFTSVVFPSLLVVAGVGIVALTPVTQMPLLVATLLTSAYLAWHYTGQAFGMIVAFGHVEGEPLEERERVPIRVGLRMLLAFHVAWIHYLFPAGAFPAWFQQGFEAGYTLLLWLLPAALGIGLVGLVRYARRIGRTPPARVLVPFVAVYCWYVLLAVEPGTLVLVQLFHALQYLVFPLRVQVNGFVEERRARGQVATRGEQIRFVLLYYGGLLASGVVLLWALPLALQSAVNSVWQLAIPAAAAGVCVQMLVNVHHYLTDAVIWKQRDPRVRKALFGHLG